ncbi:MAG: hypothetical protein C0402_12985 [Thermodesulfovibrio sp.]|nr:hypothetical protein [Thermodesulfovibrio sp.]
MCLAMLSGLLQEYGNNSIMKSMSGEHQVSDKDQYISESLDELLRTWLARLLVVGSILFLLLSFLDYVATPENYWRFLAYRVFVATILVSCIPLSKKFNSKIQIKTIGYFAVVVSAGAIELMVLQLGGHTSIYYPGQIMLGICVFSFLPASILYHLLNAVTIYLIYLLPILTFDAITHGREFFTANFFIVSIFGAMLALRYLSHQNLLHELSLQFDLKQHAEHLNDLVEEKTSKLNKAIAHLTAEIQARQRIQEELKRVSDDWSETFDIISDAITIHDREYTITRINKAARELLAFSGPGPASPKCFECYHGASQPPNECPSCQTLQTGIPTSAEVYEPHLKKYLDIKALPRFNEQGTVIGLIHVVRDISEQKRLQTQLLQIQKMDSVGRLAGGIAHDFNNILSAIIGYSEIALNRLPQDSPTLEHIRIIRDSGYRAADLTKQLLAFSRKQVLELKPVNLSSLVENVSRMLIRLIGEDVMLALQVSQRLHNVLADTVQIEQILLNLSVNARDAMPLGGRLTITTADLLINEDNREEYPDMPSGDYVVLEVTDTGIGMPKEIHEKIFEPFFTTKEKGKGTGLGLATVYGIVKQHNGNILLKSEPGKGTSFTVCLPATAEEATDEQLSQPLPLPRGTETLFVAEDEPSIRSLISDTLEPLGYRIFSAPDGKAALTFIEAYQDKIDLLLTDVIMPGMNGKELADTVKALRPDIRVLFMSGYADEKILRHGILESKNTFMQKPLSPEKLAGRIREILDAKPPGAL